MFVAMAFHRCYKESENGRCLSYKGSFTSDIRIGETGVCCQSFTCVTRREACKVFVIMELNIYYKERRVEGACHKGLSILSLDDNGRCLLLGIFTSVTRRGTSKGFVIQ